MVLVRSIFMTTLLLCGYGFFKEIHPSEPFLTEYLTDERWLNLTDDEVSQDVYPVWSYSFFTLLVPVFLITDLLRYKPMILFGGLSYITTWCLLLWARGLGAMQAMQAVYGLGTATEVAYFTYIYTKVPKEKYETVSGHVRAATLAGKCISGIMGQALVSLDLMNYHDLGSIKQSYIQISFRFLVIISFVHQLYISLSGALIGTTCSVFLPSAQSSIYFHRDSEAPFETKSDILDKKHKSLWGKTKKALFHIWEDIYSSYRQTYVLKWSIWVWISSCLYFQVGNYIQPLWKDIREADGMDEEEVLNGAIEGISNFCGAVTVFLVGYVKLPWERHWGNLAILVVASVGGAILFWMSQTSEIWVAYIGYVLFRMSYNVVMTIASFEIAKHISPTAYALIYGMNSWLGVGLQTILTLFVADDAFGFSLVPQDQYIAYALLYWVAACGYLIGCYANTIWVFISCKKQK